MDNLYPAGAPPAVAAPEITLAFREAVRVWLRIAVLSFGGPAGQIALMHRILVQEKRWIGDTRFLHALNYCMLLPGPEAQQLAIYIGWLLHKTKGGLVAGGLFVLPGAVAIMALSWIYAIFGHVPLVQGLFFGLKPAVLAIVLQAVSRLSKRALRNSVMMAIATAAFIAIFLFHVPFPLIILAAGLIGYAGGRARNPAFIASDAHRVGNIEVKDSETILGAALPEHARPTLGWSLKIGALFLLLWGTPVIASFALLGPHHVFTDIAVFFSKMAVVTFGGAYAVLAYVAQQSVDTYHWLSAPEMLDGLGMAETTPGPLIIVTQFVGFLGAYRHAGDMPPLLAGTLGGLLTTWVTFTPCFLWIFLGAPFVESLRGNKALSAALSCITAAVVGVILNLAVWFALHVLFNQPGWIRVFGVVFDMPNPRSLDVPSLVLMMLALVAVFRLKVGVVPVLGTSAVLGALWTFFGSQLP